MAALRRAHGRDQGARRSPTSPRPARDGARTDRQPRPASHRRRPATTLAALGRPRAPRRRPRADRNRSRPGLGDVSVGVCATGRWRCSTSATPTAADASATSARVGSRCASESCAGIARRTTPADAWQGYIPFEALPHERRPTAGLRRERQPARRARRLRVSDVRQLGVRPPRHTPRPGAGDRWQARSATGDRAAERHAQLSSRAAVSSHPRGAFVARPIRTRARLAKRSPIGTFATRRTASRPRCSRPLWRCGRSATLTHLLPRARVAAGGWADRACGAPAQRMALHPTKYAQLRSTRSRR